MKRLGIIVIVLVLFSYCSNNKGGKNDSNITDTILNRELYKCTLDAPKTVLSFLKWYRAHEESITGGFVNNNGTGDAGKYYSVNFDSTEKYLKELKNTGLISDAYINKWRQYFKKCDDNFKRNPSNEGPPDGFDYDFIMQSQDYDEDLINVEKAKVVSGVVKNDSATIKVNFIYGNKLVYNLSKHGDTTWLIDDIEPWQ